jgi:hypothetical protein
MRGPWAATALTAAAVAAPHHWPRLSADAASLSGLQPRIESAN